MQPETNNYRKVLIAVGVLATAIHFGYVLLAPIPFQEARNIVDDAYYYWVIARKFWGTGFFTFDGIHPTSGFQPLWQWILLPFGLLNKTLQLRLSMLLAAACFQASAWALVLVRDLPERFHKAAVIAALLLWINVRLIFEFASSGMEFGLYMLVATCAILSAAKVLWTDDSRRAWFASLCMTTALLPLARVDGLGLSGLIWLWVLIRSKNRLPVVIFGALSTLPFIAWLLANQAVFGLALPVSGLAKQMNQMAELRADNIEQWSVAWWGMGIKKTAILFIGNVLRFFSGFIPPGPWPRVVLVGGGLFFSAVAAVAGWILHRRRNVALPICDADARRVAEPILVLLAFSLCQVLVYSFTIPGSTHYAQWYYGPFYLGIALAVGWWLGTVRVDIAANAASGLLIFHLAAMCILPQPIQIANPGLRKAIAALEAQNPPEGTRIGSWNAGLVAFLAPDSVQVVNLDGLVNSVDFARKYVGDKDLRPYLSQEYIRYLVDYSTGEDAEMWRQILAFRMGTYKTGGELNVSMVYLGDVEEGTEAEPRRYFVLEVPPSATERGF
ncbi:hypothetical protein KQI84_01575 [bacterium]|nr:hypothetical protein [bacterium]